ncbi:MAG: hypothetical protein MUE60_09950, partial [Candidatus Eisenbacteria bacterium]|nr:hypothetical protein [Candidatus Eisenbacteria bacterium]
MRHAFWTPRDGIRTLVLFVACGALAIAAAALGISDSPPGILCAFLAAAAFVLAFVHPWRAPRQFLRLAGMSVAGLV